MKRTIFISLIALTLITGSAWAVDRTISRADPGQGKRIALVIGNGAYKTDPLRNPVNDAVDMAEALKGLGFRVILKTNADRRTMLKVIREFGDRLFNVQVGLFYFAGHGIQVGGRNYLLPVDAMVKTESDVEYDGIDAGRVLGKMEDARNAINIVFLDACRNNPFTRGFRSVTKGLARMDAPVGSFIAFATAPGSTAADGQGRNGIFTAQLLKHLKTPGLRIEDILKRTRKGVIAKTNRKQIPWQSSSLIGDFYFVASAGGATPAPPSSSSGDGNGPPESTDEQKIADLLGKAEAHLKAGRLTTPEGSSAADFYRMVLREEPANAQALDGLHKIVGKYVKLSRGRIKVKDWDRAETYLNRAATVSETDDRILAVRDELRMARATTTARPNITTTIPTTTAYTSPTTTLPVQPKNPKYFTNSIGMKFKLIPAGSFMMGSNNGESDERPVHKVEITKPFYIGVYEVTQAQWKRVIDPNPVNYDSSWFKGDDLPVDRAYWGSVQEFISKLNSKEGTTKYRLPTEAEWEYACRAGTKDKWYFGSDDDQLGEYAWFKGNSEGKTYPVGQKKPNAWGLYDMHGNVWEWCQDRYAKDYYERSPNVDPQGPGSGMSRNRVCRGGSWNDGAAVTRSASRGDGRPGGRGDNLGFRVAAAARTN